MADHTSQSGPRSKVESAPIRFAAAVSTRQSHSEAIAELSEHVREAIPGQPDLCMVFFTAHHLPSASAISRQINETLNPGMLIGNSAESVLALDREIERSPGISMLAASLPGARIESFTEEDLAFGADREAIRESLHVADDTRGVLLLADPFTPLGRLLPSLSEALVTPPDLPAIPLIGGVASAGAQPNQNRFFLQDRVRTGGIAGLTVSGRLRVDSLVSQGCRPIGRPMVVTGARRNLIESLGGQPALAAFKGIIQGLDDRDRELLTKGLFVGLVVNEYKDRFGRGDFLIRNVIGVDENQGYLAVSDEVRTGRTIQFHVRDARTAVEDLELLLAAQQLDSTPAGALLLTCNGRGSRLFSRPHTDVTTIGNTFPNLPMAGFFAAGEIGPVGGRSYLHGHTAALALFRSV